MDPNNQGKNLAIQVPTHGLFVWMGFTERQKKKQVEQMEEEIEELKVRLKETRAQLEAEREVENQRRAQVWKKLFGEKEGKERNTLK